MKKFMALFATSVLFASMTVSAAGSPSAAVVASTAPAAYVSEGFADAGAAQAAAARGMSAGEYYNNAIVATPGYH